MRLFDFTRKKQLKSAYALFLEAKSWYKLAIQSDSIDLFLDYWNNMKERIAEFRTYKNRIPIQVYEKLSVIEALENDFQLKLCKVMEASQKRAISDLDTEYRNRTQLRYQMFVDDIKQAKHLFSRETDAFANSAISMVASAAGIELSSNCTSHSNSLLLDIDSMDGSQFELWCKDLLSNIGFEDVTLTGKSGDQGVDLLANKDGIRYAIQCKCYSSDLGNTPIQEVNTGRVIYNCHVGAVITNRHFTEGGKAAAQATNVLLWDRDWIQEELALITNCDTANMTTNHDTEQKIVDNLYYDAVDIVKKVGYATVDILRRNLKIGYARAARIIDEMEENGVVGPFRGSKPREVLAPRNK